MKSCNDCENCIPAGETQSRLGRSTGTDLCMAHGHVLGRPGVSADIADRIKTTYAETCAEYGTPVAVRKPVIAGTVAIGDPGIASRMALVYPNGVDEHQRPTTCGSCEHFVPAEYVKNELGWALPMCAAKGRLMFPQNLIREAADCGTSIAGLPRDTTDGVILMPAYATPTGSVPNTSTQGASPFVVNMDKIDPRDYPTDRPLTPEDEAEGIRAWREIKDPEGQHPSVFMPIFDGPRVCGFDPRDTYAQHRPDLYVDHQGLLYDLAVEFFELDETPVLIGSAGTGKTELLCHVAYLCDLPFYRISVEKGTEPWHFFGEAKLVVDAATGLNVTQFSLGRYAKAYGQTYAITCVDEPNLKAEIFETLRPSFDSARQLVIDADQGFKVSRGRWSRVGCAQNPSYDPLYVGTEPMSAADIDRVSPIFVDLPSDAIERQIIAAHCNDDGYAIDTKTIDKLMQVAEALRAMIADGTLPVAWGLRSQIKVARKTRYYSLEKSYRRAIVDGMEPEVVDAILGVVRGVA